MEWNDKIEMTHLLNIGKMEEAVEFAIEKAGDDYQAWDMLITGAVLNEKEGLQVFAKHRDFFTDDKLKDIISNVGFRTGIRWSIVLEWLNEAMEE